MITVDRQEIVDALYQSDLEESALNETYSGRGMYGSTCIGVVVDGTDQLIRFVLNLGADHDWLYENIRSDNMGLGMIYYWPGVQLEETS